MNGLMKSIYLTALAVMMTASVCHAATPRTAKGLAKKKLVLTNKRDFRNGLNAAAIQPVEDQDEITSEDIQQLIPMHMKPTSSTREVASQILDRSINTFMKSDYVQSSSLGRQAKSVEKKMESKVAFGGEEDDSIKHSLKFAMKAMQTRAQLQYSGLTNAELSYTVAQSKMNFEVREPMPVMATDLVFNHINTPNDRRDTVSFRWAW